MHQQRAQIDSRKKKQDWGALWLVSFQNDGVQIRELEIWNAIYLKGSLKNLKRAPDSSEAEVLV